jgi:uncharacterized protein YkwD
MPPRRFVGFLALVLTVAAPACPRAADAPEAPQLSADEQKILDLTNAAREKEKLPALKLNQVLLKVARAHSANMARQGKMDHVLDGKKPHERVKDAGYDYSYMGENIAWTTGDPPAVVFKGWMNSEHHRENILGEHYTEIGIGIARTDKGEVYYTQVFGKPRK